MYYYYFYPSIPIIPVVVLQSRVGCDDQPSSTSMSSADQAFADILDDKVDACVAATENIPEYGCNGGVMLMVRAIAKAHKSHHAFFRTAQMLEQEGFDRSYFQNLVAEYDGCKEDLRELEREEAPYFTVKRVYRALHLMKDFRCIAKSIAFAFDRVADINPQQAHSFVQSWKEFEKDIRDLIKKHKKELK